LRITGTGHDNAVGKKLDVDFAAGVFVIAVCDGIDEGFAECPLRVVELYVSIICALARRDKVRAIVECVQSAKAKERRKYAAV
jgi:hypothetical protein